MRAMAIDTNIDTIDMHLKCENESGKLETESDSRDFSREREKDRETFLNG